MSQRHRDPSPKPGYRQASGDQLVCDQCGATVGDAETALHDRFHRQLDDPSILQPPVERSAYE